MKRCRSCNKSRPIEDMTAVTGPSGLFHVCRPDVTDLPCFRLAVMGREVHTLVPGPPVTHWMGVPIEEFIRG